MPWTLVYSSGVTIIFGPPGKHSLRALVLVLIHNSGHFGPPLPFWAPGPPALPGLLMASYATGLQQRRPYGTDDETSESVEYTDAER